MKDHRVLARVLSIISVFAAISFFVIGLVELIKAAYAESLLGFAGYVSALLVAVSKPNNRHEC